MAAPGKFVGLLWFMYAIIIIFYLKSIRNSMGNHSSRVVFTGVILDTREQGSCFSGGLHSPQWEGNFFEGEEPESAM